MKKFEEIINKLKKYKWQFLGFDKLECALSFIRNNSFYNEKIYVNNSDFSIEAYRTDTDILHREYTSSNLDLEELKLFCELLEYLQNGGRVDLRLATSQLSLDAAYEFEKWW